MPRSNNYGGENNPKEGKKWDRNADTDCLEKNQNRCRTVRLGGGEKKAVREVRRLGGGERIGGNRQRKCEERT